MAVKVVLALAGIIALPVLVSAALGVPVWELLANGLRVLFR